MSAKEAIMEIRGDVKALLETVATLQGANLVGRMTTAEGLIDEARSEIRSLRSWLLGIIVAVTTLGGGSIILQIISVAAGRTAGT